MRNKKLKGTFLRLAICTALTALCPVTTQAAGPIPPEALVKEVDLYAFEGISPSPDGKWIAYESSDPTRPIRFDYEGQRFARSGFPMLAGASGTNVWVTDLATRKSAQLTSGEFSSWSPSWSADGQQLAFYSDKSGAAALWVWDRKTGATRQISDVPIFFSWWRERPLWSHDGKSILTKVFPEGMSLQDVLSLSPMYRASLNKDKPKDPDSKTPTIRVYSYHPGEEHAAKSSTAPPVDLSAFFDATYLSDLVRVDVETGNATRLVKRVRPISYGYSPDQQHIAYISIDGTVPKTQQGVFTIKVYNVAEDTTTEVAQGFKSPNIMNSGISWSPDSTRIAYVNTGKAADLAAWVVEIKTGKKTKISDGIDKSSRTFSWGAPLWNRDGSRLYLLDPEQGRLWEAASDGSSAREVVRLPGLKVKDLATDSTFSKLWSTDDGKTLYIRAHNDASKTNSFYSVQIESGQAGKIYESNESISFREMGTLVGVPGTSTLVYTSESAMRPTDIWGLSTQTGKTQQISTLNPQFDPSSMGQVRVIDFYSLRSEHLHAALLLPNGFKEGTRYPTVVWVYGGDMGSDKANRFAFGWGGTFNPQMLASRGYAVLYPDVPLHEGTPVDDLVSVVIPAVNRATELGVTDSQRLAVMGQSFGGYNTIALLTRTTMFKAAVATSAASTDLFAGYSYFMDGSAPWEGYYEEGQGSMRGNPWEFKTRYWENSPFFFLEKVSTPLMIERGTTDTISVQSENVFNALKRLHKDVELLEYEHEGHVVQQPVNVIDFWNRRIEWLDRYLNVMAPSNGATTGSGF